jgi:hypothetical protein
MMAGIMILNIVMSIGDVFMVHQKNLNVLVVQLGIIMQIVVIGLTVLIVHVLKRQHLNQYLKMMKNKKLAKEILILMNMVMIHLLLFIKKKKRKRKKIEN